MQKKYDVYVKRVDYNNKPSIGDSAIIKPIKDLTQSIIYWQKHDIIKANLYYKVYLAKEEQIYGTLQLLNNEDLADLMIISKGENNLMLYDICASILQTRMMQYNIEDLEQLFIVNEQKYLIDPSYFSFVRDGIIRCLKTLDADELKLKEEYFKGIKSETSKKYFESKRNLDDADLQKLLTKSPEVIEAVLRKDDIKCAKREQDFALVNMYRVLEETTKNLRAESEKRSL